MLQRGPRKSPYGAPSMISTTNEMSKVTNKLQTMDFDSSTRKIKGEDEWTTIEKGRSARKPSKISFA